MERVEEIEKHWFAMRDLRRPNAKVPAFRQLTEAGFDVFTPVREKIMSRGGRKVREEVPVIHDLLFVNSSRDRLDPVVERTDTLQYRFVKGGGYREPLIVPTPDMQRFITVVNSAKKVDYYRPEEITPAMIGEEVRILCDGPFNCHTGKLAYLRGSRKKKLVVILPGIIAAKVEVTPDFIQLIRHDE